MPGEADRRDPPDLGGSARRRGSAGPGDLDPGLVLLPGRADPAALLSVWLLRKSFWAFLWFGLASVVWVSGSAGYEADELDSWGDRVGALGSPLAGLVIAIAVRLVAAGLGYLLAARVARSVDVVRRSVASDRWRVPALLSDQLHVAQAYRALRWTKAVRVEAADRLGALGNRFALAERVLATVTWTLAGGTVVLSLVRGQLS